MTTKKIQNQHKLDEEYMKLFNLQEKRITALTKRVEKLESNPAPSSPETDDYCACNPQTGAKCMRHYPKAFFGSVQTNAPSSPDPVIAEFLREFNKHPNGCACLDCINKQTNALNASPRDVSMHGLGLNMDDRLFMIDGKLVSIAQFMNHVEQLQSELSDAKDRMAKARELLVHDVMYASSKKHVEEIMKVVLNLLASDESNVGGKNK